MTHFKTSKAELLFVVADKEINGANLQQLYSFWLQLYTGGTVAKTKPLPQGNWQLIGKLSEVSEEVAKGLVDDFKEPEFYTNYVDYVNGGKETKYDGIRSIVVGFTEAIPSLTSIATRTGQILVFTVRTSGESGNCHSCHKNPCKFSHLFHIKIYLGLKILLRFMQK